ncbi:hypothetical protein JTE90_011559 [Oedothorax gibbosus]|uniref:DNA-directed DNA polymerase n=1 Tax=Oedothorax gibbosus TaxID=931172 RepID=A0AAV6TGR1_9ARAC|nr:hypothetical protein JTE90_011559 [Oedothorax gibbosus]
MCCKVIERRKCPMDRHICDTTQCQGCKAFVSPGHLCYLPRIATKQPSENLLFFVFETQQDTGIHFVNYAVTQYHDGQEFVFRGADALNQFCCFLFDARHKGFTAIAHNMKGFDGQFILRWLLERGHEPSVIPQGSKLMCVDFSPLSIKLIDSFNFLPMALSQFPKTFGITELEKGYFPHLFNTAENQDYIGPLPDASYYSTDTMSVTARENFFAWYKERKKIPLIFKRKC